MAVLPGCRAQGIRVVTNMGAAHPTAARRATVEVAREVGLDGLRVASVSGDDVTELVRTRDPVLLESGRHVSDLGERLVSANAYLGADPMVEALDGGADVVLTGRVADPSLVVAVQRHAFGWTADDWSRLGQGTVVGHLLECAGQITGGYFAEPGPKDVAGLARLGFPIGIVEPDGSVVVTKVDGSGGCVTSRTCTEQLLYELHRPDRYVTPDTEADFSGVVIEEVGPDRVRVTGGRGHPRPDTLKVSVGYRDGFVGDGQISYAGPGAVARARLAGEIIGERLAMRGVRPRELRQDLMGIDALHDGIGGPARPDPYEVRLRVAIRTETLIDAQAVGREVEALLTNGPAGGGGFTRSARPTVAVESTLVPRALVTTAVEVETV